MVTELRVTNDLARPYSVSRMLILQNLYYWLLVYYLQLNVLFMDAMHIWPARQNFIFQQLRYRYYAQVRFSPRYEKQGTLKQFLDHDRHVLHFCVLLLNSMFGDPVEMALHSVIADDTIEVREISARLVAGMSPRYLSKRFLMPSLGIELFVINHFSLDELYGVFFFQKKTRWV